MRTTLLVLCFLPCLLAAITLSDFTTSLIGVHYCVQPDRESNSNLVMHFIKSESQCLAHCEGCRWVTRHGFKDEADFHQTISRAKSTLGQGSVRSTWLLKIKDGVSLSHEEVAQWQSSMQVDFGQFLHSDSGDYFIVLATSQQAHYITSRLEAVSDMVPFPSHLKVSPHLAENIARIKAAGALRSVSLLLSLHATPNRPENIAKALEVLMLEEQFDLESFTVTVEAPKLISLQVRGSDIELAVDVASSLEDVTWVDLNLDYKPLNFVAKSLMQSGTEGAVAGTPGATPYHDAGLHGENEIVAVADSGSDYNSCFFFDPNTPMTVTTGQTFTSTTHRKYVTYVAFADGDEGEDAGHGTHVTGTIVGNSLGALPQGNGHAYNAKLSFFDIGVAGQQFLSVPNSLLTQMFPIHYTAGARLHSDSWGSNANQYDQRTQDIDQFSFTNQDWLVMVAAGNSGANGAGTIGTPATAKNCVTVGAAVSPDHGSGCTEGNAPCYENMASFSSLGPMYDGRQAPIIVAPGYFTYSARSSASLTATTPPQCALASMAGTSMATPTTTGNAALIRQYFREGRYPDGVAKSGGFNAMGSLVKAVLVNSAKSMKGTFKVGNNNNALQAAPTSVQGFGRVQLNRTLALPDSPFNFWAVGDTANQIALGTGDGYSVSFTVKSGYPFKVTLVWSDYPASLSASTSLVNDLDLNITSPSGQTLFPNNGNAPDTLNVVEQIETLAPTDGVYTVHVGGKRVVQGPQPFSLVVTGTFTASAPGSSNTPSNPGNPFAGGGGAATNGASTATSSNTIAAGVMLPIAIIACGVLLFLFGARLGDRMASAVQAMGHAVSSGFTLFLTLGLLLVVLVAVGSSHWASQSSSGFHLGLWQSCSNAGCSDTTQIQDGKGLIYALRFFMMSSIFTSAFVVIAMIAAAAEKLPEALYRVAYGVSLVTTVFTFISMCLFAAYFNDVLLPISAQSVSTDYCYFLVIASFFISILGSLFVYAVWKVHTGGVSSSSSSSAALKPAITYPESKAPTSPPPSSYSSSSSSSSSSKPPTSPPPSSYPSSSSSSSSSYTSSAYKPAPAKPGQRGTTQPPPASMVGYSTPAPMAPAPTPTPAPATVPLTRPPNKAPPPRSPPPPKPALPANWIVYTTDDTNEPYYYNTVTQETRWEIPTS